MYLNTHSFFCIAMHGDQCILHCNLYIQHHDWYIFLTTVFHSFPCMDSTTTIGIADDIQGIYQTGHGLSKG